MYFDVKAPGKKSSRDRTLTKLLKSTAIMNFNKSFVI